MAHPEKDATEGQTAEPNELPVEPFDPQAKDGGSIGGGASGPRETPTAGRGEGEDDADIEPTKAAETEQTGGWGTGTQGSSNVSGQQAQASGGQSPPPENKGQEEIENYGSRRESEPAELLSPSSQIGRSSQTGGTPESGRHPDETSREGWTMPDQSDTPEEWPAPTPD
jgi:hypothetical protein